MDGVIREELVYRDRSLLVGGASWVLLLGWRDSY